LPLLLVVSAEGIEFTPSQNIAVGDDIAYKVSCTATTGTKNIAVIASNQYVNDSALIETTISAPTGTINPNDGDTITIGPGVSSLQVIGNGGAGVAGVDATFGDYRLVVSVPGNQFPTTLSSLPSALYTSWGTYLGLRSNYYFPDRNLYEAEYRSSDGGFVAGYNKTPVIDAVPEKAGADATISGDLSFSFAGAAEGITDTPPESTETLVLDPTQTYTITVSKPAGTSLRLEY